MLLHHVPLVASLVSWLEKAPGAAVGWASSTDRAPAPDRELLANDPVSSPRPTMRAAGRRTPPQGRVAPPALPHKVHPEHHQGSHDADQHRARTADTGHPLQQQRDPDATQNAVDRADHAGRGEQHLGP